MSTTVTKTVVAIAGVDETSELNGDVSIDVIREQYSAFFPYILNCSVTTRIENGVKYVTFAERLGTKG